jgi:hypothetical protein
LGPNTTLIPFRMSASVRAVSGERTIQQHSSTNDLHAVSVEELAEGGLGKAQKVLVKQSSRRRRKRISDSSTKSDESSVATGGEGGGGGGLATTSSSSSSNATRRLSTKSIEERTKSSDGKRRDSDPRARATTSSSAAASSGGGAESVATNSDVAHAASDVEISELVTIIPLQHSDCFLMGAKKCKFSSFFVHDRDDATLRRAAQVNSSSRIPTHMDNRETKIETPGNSPASPGLIKPRRPSRLRHSAELGCDVHAVREHRCAFPYFHKTLVLVSLPSLLTRTLSAMVFADAQGRVSPGDRTCILEHRARQGVDRRLQHSRSDSDGGPFQASCKIFRVSLLFRLSIKH